MTIPRKENGHRGEILNRWEILDANRNRVSDGGVIYDERGDS
jgi:hypothetical protein